MGVVGLCLRREGEWDGGVEELEGAVLGGGGKGDLVEGAVAEGDGVAGQGGQVVEQAAEAVQGAAVVVGVAGGFGVGVW